jgi:hypothetical protein
MKQIRILRSLIVGAAAATLLLALGAQSAGAEEGCAPTAGPTDVVPNPMPSTSWKGGAVGGNAAPPCGQPSDPGVTLGGTPREPIDIPPNPERRKEPVNDQVPEGGAEPVSTVPSPSSEIPTQQAIAPAIRAAGAKATPKKKAAKLRRGAKKAAKSRAAKRLKLLRSARTR